MPTISARLAIAPLALLSLLGTACQNTEVAETPAIETSKSVETKTISIILPAGSLFSVVGVNSRKGDAPKDARAIFYGQAIPLASTYGFQQHGFMNVDAVSAASLTPKDFCSRAGRAKPRLKNFSAIRSGRTTKFYGPRSGMSFAIIATPRMMVWRSISKRASFTPSRSPILIMTIRATTTNIWQASLRPSKPMAENLS